MRGVLKLFLGVLLKALPMDQIVAAVLNELVRDFVADPENEQHYERLLSVLEHIAEALAVARMALDDRDLNDGEVQAVMSAARNILEAWAVRGETPKTDLKTLLPN